MRPAGSAASRVLIYVRRAERLPAEDIDVDDVRQLVVTGAAAPWEGEEGREQQRLGVKNACSLARNFLTMGIEVVIADVLTPETCDLYRRELPGCLIVHMTVGLPEAMRRAAYRKVWPTDHEFRMLHEMSCGALTLPGHRRTTVEGRSGRRGAPKSPAASARRG
jgi:hypothetical protein